MVKSFLLNIINFYKLIYFPIEFHQPCEKSWKYTLEVILHFWNSGF